MSAPVVKPDPTVMLAWHLANQEAYLCKVEAIDCIHYYIASLMIIEGHYPFDSDHAKEYKIAMNKAQKITAEKTDQYKFDLDEISSLRKNLCRNLRCGGVIVTDTDLPRSNELRKVFRQALASSKDSDRLEINFFDVFSIIARQFSPDFDKEGITPGVVLEVVMNSQGRTAGTGEPLTKNTTMHIDSIGRNLSALAREGKLSSIIGRDNEITSIIRSLNRTSKRNVILIGNAGVGKSAIVEGLAIKLAEETTPDYLERTRIVQINIADLISGTQYRGQMEARLQEILKEAASDPDLVLFIDEIHLIVKAGSVEGGTMDVANILKPALARGDFRCIGATTTDEFEQTIKQDSALMRRFQVIRVGEPSEETLIAICNNWVARIEKAQKVKFQSHIVPEVIALCNKHLRNRPLPDIAIDLLETSAAMVKIPASFDKLPSSQASENAYVVTSQVIQKVMEEHFQISIQTADLLNPQRVLGVLEKNIVGQGKALQQIADTLSFGLRRKKPNRPLSIMLFTGPTGVGKTFAAECICKTMFPDDGEAFLRINMNEYKERWDLSKITGAAPGLIGHDKQGLLFSFIDTHPQGVVLLDEIEKSHPEIQDFFLQIFDTGIGRDSRGQAADFSGQIFIMTGNIVESKPSLRKPSTITKWGDVTGSRDFNEILESYFRPEFLGRIDQVIQFGKLAIDDFRLLFNQKLAELSEELGLKIHISDSELLNIVLHLSSKPDGARGFLRRFEQEIAVPAWQMTKTGERVLGVTILWEDNKIHLELKTK